MKIIPTLGVLLLAGSASAYVAGGATKHVASTVFSTFNIQPGTCSTKETAEKDIGWFCGAYSGPQDRMVQSFQREFPNLAAQLGYSVRPVSNWITTESGKTKYGVYIFENAGLFVFVGQKSVAFGLQKYKVCQPAEKPNAKPIAPPKETLGTTELPQPTCSGMTDADFGDEGMGADEESSGSNTSTATPVKAPATSPTSKPSAPASTVAPAQTSPAKPTPAKPTPAKPTPAKPTPATQSEIASSPTPSSSTLALPKLEKPKPANTTTPIQTSNFGKVFGPLKGEYVNLQAFAKAIGGTLETFSSFVDLNVAGTVLTLDFESTIGYISQDGRQSTTKMPAAFRMLDGIPYIPVNALTVLGCTVKPGQKEFAIQCQTNSNGSEKQFSLAKFGQ
jgi:hypothetical protein